MLYIKELRKSTGQSQDVFAKSFNIPVSTLRKWEQNESTPPSYVIDLIEKALPYCKKDYQCYIGKNGKKYFLDATNKKVGDSLGNWIPFHEDMTGVMKENIGIYIENLFDKYYEIIKSFDNDLKFDKIDKIRWR